MRPHATASVPCAPMQPFEPELPWPEFSVAVAEGDVPRMHTLLAAISPAKLEQMQVGQCEG